MNTQFEIVKEEFDGVKLIKPFYIEDSRGYFLKSFEKDTYKQWGLDANIFEDFESYSQKGVIRGLHFQLEKPQIKIVRVLRGIVRDVIVDLRKNSETYGKHRIYELSDENHIILWIPKGFAHGFEVISDEGALMSYKCIGKYMKGTDTGIFYGDKKLNIPWENANPIVSDRDSQLMSFEEFTEKHKGL